VLGPHWESLARSCGILSSLRHSSAAGLLRDGRLCSPRHRTAARLLAAHLRAPERVRSAGFRLTFGSDEELLRVVRLYQHLDVLARAQHCPQGVIGCKQGVPQDVPWALALSSSISVSSMGCSMGCREALTVKS
jgi:hypothetical protein